MTDQQIKWECPGDDYFLYDTMQDAIDASGGEIITGSTIRFGEFVPYQNLSAHELSWVVISEMADDASDKCREAADDYDMTLLNPHRKSLLNHLKDWLSDLSPAMFGTIKNIQTHTVTAEDMA